MGTTVIDGISVVDKEKIVVLVVDDDPVSSERIRAGCVASGYKVEVTDNPEKAIELARDNRDKTIAACISLDLNGQDAGRDLLTYFNRFALNVGTCAMTRHRDEEEYEALHDEAIAAGALHVFVKPVRIRRFCLLIAVINNSVNRTSFDQITGLPKRDRFEEVVNTQLAQALRDKTPETWSFIFVDIDDFKNINDKRGGHDVGDMVLRQIAITLTKQLQRQVDKIGRWGGDEMAVSCPGMGEVDAERMAERMRVAVSHLQLVDGYGEPLEVLVSVGSVTVTLAEIAKWGRLAPILKAADAKMYQDKKMKWARRLGIELAEGAD